MEVKKFTKSFTLIEVLMATSIFTAIGLIAIAIFININNLQLRSNMENALYEDARFMMSRLSRAVRNNAIDYEEYFNQELGNCKQYGDTYGAYAAQFYNPGAMKNGEKNNKITPTPNGDYGAFCNDGTPYTGQQNCVVYKPSVDNNTGQFPIPALKNNGKLASNAFCPAALSGSSCQDSTAPGINIKKQLYLISPNGKKKIIFALKQVNNTPQEYALAELSLTGKDKKHDGITNQWRDPTNGSYYCSTGFQCPPTLNTLKSTLKVGKDIGLYEGFVPISPIRSTVSNLYFIINPKDDPHKAFAEKNLEQPHVIIIMTLKPSASEMSKFPTAAAVPSITLETIVTSRVQTEVKSYLGYGTENIGNGLKGLNGSSIGTISNGWQCS